MRIIKNIKVSVKLIALFVIILALEIATVVTGIKGVAAGSELAKTYGTRLGVIGFILAVIIVVSAFMLAFQITRPIRLLSKDVDKLKDGDLSVVPESDTKDEIGMLSNDIGQMSKAFSSYINEIDRRLSAISNGDLSTQNEVEFVGDFKNIGKALDALNNTMNSIMGEIAQASELVASGSETVASAAQLLAEGSTEQAGSVKNVSDTMKIVNEKIRLNAEKSSQADEKATDIRGQADKSHDDMVRMVEAMEDISEKSNEIAKIIKTIDDIAFNTNILALNAAVEAARAGEAGEGFAVVAEEVRNLAGKSQEAAANTAGLIEGTISSVNSGTEIARATAETLNKVVSGVQEISEVIGQISSATNEQAETIANVTSAIDDINNVIQTTSATAEESAASSQELSAQSGVLQSIVEKFKAGGGKRERRYSAIENKTAGYIGTGSKKAKEKDETDPLRIGVNSDSKY